MSAPKPGDRMRVVVEGTVPTKVVNGSLLSLSRLLDPEIVSEEIVTPAERWQAGDVVRNADDAGDKRAWEAVVVPSIESATGAIRWRLLGGLASDTTAYPRNQLPDRLTLIVRDGRRVLREPTDEDFDAARAALALSVGADAATSNHGLREIITVIDERRT